LNIHPVYNLKISKFSTILSDHLLDSQPAVRPSSTSAMAPDFLHKKGNRLYETAIPKVYPLRHGLPFIHRSFPFSSTPL